MSWTYRAPTRPISWDEVVGAHADAAAALEAGEAYGALALAKQAGDRERYGCALILCGWLERGLAILDENEINDPRCVVIQAYALWALGRRDDALAALRRPPLARARRLADLIGRERIRLLIVTDGRTQRGIPSGDTENFEIRAVVSDDKPAPSLGEVLSDGFAPDLVLALDVFGAQIPAGIFDLGVPVAFWVYDFDYFAARQNDDLERADLIAVSSAEERYVLAHAYGARVVHFLTHDVYTDPGRHVAPAAHKDIDILHTGQSFTPLHRGKAQYLFELATLDDPSLKIRICNEFYTQRAYRDGLSRAKFVAVHERVVGGFQTRQMDAVCAGATPLLSDDVTATVLLREVGVPFVDFRHGIQQPSGATPDFATNLRQIFPPSPARELRFLKYCMFQALFIPEERHAAPVRESEAEAHTQLYREVAGDFAEFLARPLDPETRQHTRESLKRGLARFPDSLPFLFVFARFLWSIDEKPEAVATFRRLVEVTDTGRFDPLREDIRFVLMPSNAEIMPYSDYVNSLRRDIVDGRRNWPGARAIVAATALSFIALNELQVGSLDVGIAMLEQALDRFPEHFAAARILAKAYFAAGRPAAEVSAAVDRAIGLYGPSLTELLPFAIAAANAAGGGTRALELVRRWCYFVTRVSWQRALDHPIPEQTWQAVEPFLDVLPANLAAAVRARRAERAAGKP